MFKLLLIVLHSKNLMLQLTPVFVVYIRRCCCNASRQEGVSISIYRMLHLHAHIMCTCAGAAAL